VCRVAQGVVADGCVCAVAGRERGDPPQVGAAVAPVPNSSVAVRTTSSP
jgi:hypothetical protein